MTQVSAIEHGASGHRPELGGVRRCRPGDAGAIAALAFRCVWRRRQDGPGLERALRLLVAPVTMFLFALETPHLWTDATRTAVVSVQPWTHRNRTTAKLVVTVLVPMALLIVAGLALGAEDQMLVVSLLLIALLFPQSCRHRAVSELVAARRRLDLPGDDVVEATSFMAAAPGAGMALARHLCALADATGTTIVAEARGLARQRLYRRLGFEAMAEARGAALLMRRPAPGHLRPSPRSAPVR